MAQDRSEFVPGHAISRKDVSEYFTNNHLRSINCEILSEISRDSVEFTECVIWCLFKDGWLNMEDVL